MNVIQLSLNLLLLTGAVNTGVLVSNDRAILIDCCDTVTEERLAGLGVEQVDMILCTQYRRPNTAGVYRFLDKGAKIAAPEREREYFENTDAYWSEWRNRWHLYHSQPGPEMPVRPIPVDRGVEGGDTIEWEGFRIGVIDTPGATMGAVSYCVEADGATFCFSGDALYGPGKILDIYSLQKGYEYGVADYHGFLGNLRLLEPTLDRLVSCGAGILIPSHGELIRDPRDAVSRTKRNLDEAWLSYSALSSLRFWFPEMMKRGEGDPRRMAFAESQPPVDFVKRIPETTHVIISESGAAFVLDCGDDHVVTRLGQMIGSGEITGVEGVWITHYHDDRVDGIGRLYNRFRCPVITDEHVAEVVAHPRRFYLPCISHTAVPVTRVTVHGESWRWREFTMTAYHFPGQPLHRGALLVEGRGRRLFFAGDSFSPGGIDDYCSWNRNFLSEERGYLACLYLVKQLKPDLILMSHKDLTFSFSDEQIELMERVLRERERIYADLLPGDDPNFGTDPWWMRTYPYDQDVFRGAECTVEVRFTNHGSVTAVAHAEPVLPEGWSWSRESSENVAVKPKTDGAVRFSLSPSVSVKAGQYIIPFRTWWNGVYLGQTRHAILRVIE